VLVIVYGSRFSQIPGVHTGAEHSKLTATVGDVTLTVVNDGLDDLDDCV